MSFIGALGLALGMFVPAQADTTGTVTVTGQIVPSPLSMTIAQTTIAFGNIDAAGTPQQSTVSATPWRDSNGSYWVADTQVNISISSPVAWTGKVCHATGGTKPSSGLSIALNNKPGTLIDATTAFNSYPLSQDCLGAVTWGADNPGQKSRTVYFVTKVLDSDSPSTLNVSVVFSVTPS